MRRLASCMRSAMRRRNPNILIPPRPLPSLPCDLCGRGRSRPAWQQQFVEVAVKNAPARTGASNRRKIDAHGRGASAHRGRSQRLACGFGLGSSSCRNVWRLLAQVLVPPLVLRLAAFDLEHHKLRTNGKLAALLAIARRDAARHGRDNLDCRLVGHDVDEGLLFADFIANGSMPFHNLGFGDTFAHIGKLENITAHLPHPAMILRIASATRSGPGKYSHSNSWGYGVSHPVTRRIGASR